MDRDRAPINQAVGAPLPVTVSALLDQAADIRRRATREDEYELVRPILDQARGFGMKAFERAVALLASDDASERAVACDLLGSLCNPDDETWGPGVASAVIGLAEREGDPDVLRSVSRALGYARDPRGVAALVSLAGHRDSDVRFQVALSLPSCEEGADPEVLAQALIGLMGDPDEDIRDWATFGLGTQTDIDGPEVREALFRRLNDDNLDARDEAIVGLARRRDSRVLAVVAAQLNAKEVGRLVVEAAAYLANELLVAPLQALRTWWDVDPDLLDEAIRACDPGEQEQGLSLQTALLAQLEDRLVAWPEVRAWLCCERLERCVTLVIAQRDQIRCYDFDRLVRGRSGGDLQAAIDAVVSDLA
jgi:HEAT repeat protein